MGTSPSTKPPEAAPVPARLRVDFLRARSLLWLLPERAARWTSWAVVALACIVPTILLLSMAVSRSDERQEQALAAMFSERLGGPVHLKMTAPDAPGRFRLADIAVGVPGEPRTVSLRCREGRYHAPANEPGRLDLEDGTLRMDLEAWTRGPSGTVVGILHKAFIDKNLRSISLSRFTADLHLGGERLSLKGCVGRAETTQDGKIEGRLVGHPTGGGGVTVAFELGEDVQCATVSSRALPWVGAVLTPTLGDVLAGLLDMPRGKVMLANELGAGSPGDHWRLDVDTGLDLARLPEELGLGAMTGRLNVTLKAWGALGKPGKLTARLHLAEGTPATVSDAALRNLRALLHGAWGELPEEPTTHTLGALELTVIVTSNFVCLTTADGDPPSGIFGADGGSLLDGLPGQVIPIGVFLDRLEKLRRLWKEDHSS
ncbi:MAG TPA: hypothetical protein VMZ92_01375 [Planctomycetota bacterium]|nr:hypothetical protein [Planctomycetota bacterium]